MAVRETRGKYLDLDCAVLMPQNMVVVEVAVHIDGVVH